MRPAILTIVLLSACTTAPVTRPEPPAPPVLIDEWRKADNRATCAPITIADPGDRARGGTPRRANFSGGCGPNWLAQIRIPDQTCIYYVWSFLGREHLEYLIGQVRRPRSL